MGVEMRKPFLYFLAEVMKRRNSVILCRDKAPYTKPFSFSLSILFLMLLEDARVFRR